MTGIFYITTTTTTQTAASIYFPNLLIISLADLYKQGETFSDLNLK
jgi:hypothetical protein